ncbi:RNA polymerase sigma factor, sigma-70 family [Thermomonospora echinospora]|uniref:RNA polymerase sigma factor, sigma-70 family n=1 Tax=Thermomonospora echinospora TaxID=1992 RepID=A0A1H6DMG4_9ACTN|nr:sigma-70 family RNA polymerase sigma factor [Thermomonospora echinospora]SEG86452.1 RNA polymerase sigma factor, sigma-70 family [Thermomonospora echinospora]
MDEVGALVRAAAGGDAAAWESLVARFSGLVWSVARGHGLGAAEAEEVFQITWFRFAEHIGRIRSPEQAGAWLATTARNESRKAVRVGSRVALTSDLDTLVPGVDDLSPEQVMLDAEDAELDRRRDRELVQALEELPGRCRELLRMLLASPPPSYAEVSQALGIPVGSIGPTRARCLSQLRELLVERGITGGAAQS